MSERAINLFVDAELRDEARRMRIKISDTLERGLRNIVHSEQEKRWLAENREAIASINYSSTGTACSPAVGTFASHDRGWRC